MNRIRDRLPNARSLIFLFAMASLAIVILAGCNYPTRQAATATLATASEPSPTIPSSATPSPIFTPAPSQTPLLSPMPAASDTPAATALPPTEQVGVVFLLGKEIGSIQKIGDKFQYTPNPDLKTPEVAGKVVLQIMDPQKVWGFDLENSSSPFYNIREDARPGWEGYGMLVAYEGSYEIILRFTALNAQSGEKIKSRVRIKIVGATVLATDTPEVEPPPLP